MAETHEERMAAIRARQPIPSDDFELRMAERRLRPLWLALAVVFLGFDPTREGDHA